MKKPILYFIAGMFLSLSVFAFWAFKGKTDDGGGYAVVQYNLNSKTTFAYEDGRIEEIKYTNKTGAEDMVLLLHKMDAAGYTLINSQERSSTSGGGGGTFCYFFIFKKK